VWKLGLRLVWNLGLGTSVGTRLEGRWKLGLGYIGHSHEWKGPKFFWEHHRNKIVYFLKFLPSIAKGFNNHSYEWIGFWLERWKLFYSKRWMTHVCMTWYDVWIFFCIFLNKFELFPISLLFRIHGIILLWYFLLFLNHFFGLINLLTNIFLIISFETLFEWHAWNCQGLGKVWMRWWRLTRELPRFELVSRHKMCLGFPNSW